MTVRKTIALLVAAVAVTAGTASAATIKWIPVSLGTHRFGQLQRPDAVVARATAGEVAFKKGGGCGCLDGPSGPTMFDVSRSGSIWVLDVLNRRLLVWRAGAPAHPARTIEFPKLDMRDFVLGRDGSVYLYAVYAEPPAGDSGANLWKLTPAGKTIWRVHALTGSGLRLGPNGAVYSVGVKSASSWTPLTTPTGRPLSIAQQRRGTTPFRPLGGGLHLISTPIGPHEVHFALVDSSQKVVRAWRVTSRTQISVPQAFGATLLRGDLVTALDVSRGKLLEHVVVRLSSSGLGALRSLDGKAVFGAAAAAGLRVGKDGRLYQLRTNPKTGLSVARYVLG